MESPSAPHGTDHLPCSLRCFWIFLAAFVNEWRIRLTVVVSRCRWMLPMADRISSHVFQNVYMNSKHVSFFYTHGAWKVVLASGCWSVRFKLSGQWSGKERRRLNSKVWSLGNSCCGMVTSCSFFVPFPMNCQSPAPSASESLCRYNILMCGFRYNLHETIMLFRRRNRSVLFPRSS